MASVESMITYCMYNAQEHITVYFLTKCFDIDHILILGNYVYKMTKYFLCWELKIDLKLKIIYFKGQSPFLHEFIKFVWTSYWLCGWSSNWDHFQYILEFRNAVSGCMNNMGTLHISDPSSLNRYKSEWHSLTHLRLVTHICIKKIGHHWYR